MAIAQHKNSNDLLFAIAKRTKELADLPMKELRSAGGYGCGTSWEAQQMHKGGTRGKIMEFILLEEFYEEYPLLFSEE